MPEWVTQIVAFSVVIIGATWRLSAMLRGIQSELETLASKIEHWEGRHDRMEQRVRSVEDRTSRIEREFGL